jgi:hypothetical protein
MEYWGPEAVSALRKNGAFSPAVSKAKFPDTSGAAVRRTAGLEESLRETDVAAASDDATPVTWAPGSLVLLEPHPTPIRPVTTARTNDCIEILVISAP